MPINLDFIGEMSKYSIYGRYPELGGRTPSQKGVKEIVKKTEEVLEWLLRQL